MAELKPVKETTRAKRGPGPKSGTQYPYFDLGDSIKVAEAVHNRGGGSCSREQLAAFLNYKTTRSGTFLSRIYAAKQFGLINLNREGATITELANRILHPVFPEDEPAAKVEAFLGVPLFSQVYEKFKGSTLPAQPGLRNLLENQFDIVKDRVKPALRVLLESADQAGFFETSGNRSRMIAPVLNMQAKDRPPASPDPQKNALDCETSKPQISNGGTGDGPPPGIHTAIIGLLRELPKPGTKWPATEKQRFMGAFQATIDFIYPEPEAKEK